jgi:hypothetical protein
MGMTEPNRKRRGSTFATWTVCILILGFLYIASAGPANWLYTRGWISESVLVVYYPLGWIADNTDFYEKSRVGRAYALYVDWWGH